MSNLCTSGASARQAETGKCEKGVRGVTGCGNVISVNGRSLNRNPERTGTLAAALAGRHRLDPFEAGVQLFEKGIHADLPVTLGIGEGGVSGIYELMGRTRAPR